MARGRKHKVGKKHKGHTKVVPAHMLGKTHHKKGGKHKGRHKK